MRSFVKLIALQIVLFAVTAWLAGMKPQVIVVLVFFLLPVSALAGRWILGEWSEEKLHLEASVRRIRSDLEKQTEALTKEREEISMIMASISDGILAVDLKGKPLFFNTRFALLFTDKELQSSGAHLGEIFRASEVLGAFESSLRDGIAREVNIPLYVRDDSIVHDFSLAAAPLKGRDGKVYGAVGIFHDVSELKRAEKIRIEFVANVSHELRTPLTAIKGYTDTLREDFQRGDLSAAEKFLGIITRNTDRLMRLIEDLLDLSSLESSEATNVVHKANVDTRELTEKVLLPLEAKCAEKRQEFESRFHVANLNADPARVEQVLVNLVENAIKYSPAGTKITIEWEPCTNAVRLHVRDTGPGIPREHHARLFERFYRVDQARSRELGGTGLGLAIVKHILQLHGGSVWVESERGRGTEFICEFPA